MTQRTSKRPPAKPKRKLSALWWTLGGLVGLGLIVLLAMSIATEEGVDQTSGYGVVTVEGDPLPTYSEPTNDPAAGMTLATVSGGDWDGNQTTIAPDGTPKIVVLLAHWCPHCQREVPIIQQWINDGNLPAGIDMYSVTVFTDPLRANWPPQDWLVQAGWTTPVIMDDAAGTAATAFGMASTPMYVVLDGNNQVVQRISGEIGTDGLDALTLLALQAAG